MSLFEWFGASCFRYVHGHHLVYNTCWEDPRLDRMALDLTADDTLLVITSAGCNVLDYALQGPKHIYAVDMNPRQNALLDLKMSGIRNLDFGDFFEVFGKGRHASFRELYHDALRDSLSPVSKAYLDKREGFFAGNGRKSFYFRGASGLLAWMVKVYLDCMPRLRNHIEAFLAADTLEAQREIYLGGLRQDFWRGYVRWFVGRNATLSLAGVPRPQRQQVEAQFGGDIADFVLAAVDAVFSHLPFQDNYFWRVYLTGEYSPQCCPEYLKQKNFEALRKGLVDRISTHNNTVEGFLRGHEGRISRFVLLDHMDWLSTHAHPALAREWQAILDKAAPETRAIWRSGGMTSDFVDRVPVSVDGKPRQMGDLLAYDRAMAGALHTQDRVHTYGSFHIADLVLT